MTKTARTRRCTRARTRAPLLMPKSRRRREGSSCGANMVGCETMRFSSPSGWHQIPEDETSFYGRHSKFRGGRMDSVHRASSAEMPDSCDSFFCSRFSVLSIAGFVFSICVHAAGPCLNKEALHACWRQLQLLIFQHVDCSTTPTLHSLSPIHSTSLSCFIYGNSPTPENMDVCYAQTLPPPDFGSDIVSSTCPNG